MCIKKANWKHTLNCVTRFIVTTFQVILFILCFFLILSSVYQFWILLSVENLLSDLKIPYLELHPIGYVKSVILFGTAVHGCHGTYNRNSKHLMLFAIVLSVFGAIHGVSMFGIVSFADVRGLERNATNTLRAYAESYQYHVPPGKRPNRETRLWDFIQDKLYCCGLESPEDWPKWRGQLKQDWFPDSCCLWLENIPSMRRDGKCHTDIVNKVGCSERLDNISMTVLFEALIDFLRFLIMAGLAIIIAKHTDSTDRSKSSTALKSDNRNAECCPIEKQEKSVGIVLFKRPKCIWQATAHRGEPSKCTKSNAVEDAHIKQVPVSNQVVDGIL